jgi:hypothetical protein
MGIYFHLPWAGTKELSIPDRPDLGVKIVSAAPYVHITSLQQAPLFQLLGLPRLDSGELGPDQAPHFLARLDDLLAFDGVVKPILTERTKTKLGARQTLRNDQADSLQSTLFDLRRVVEMAVKHQQNIVWDDGAARPF